MSFCKWNSQISIKTKILEEEENCILKSVIASAEPVLYTALGVSGKLSFVLPFIGTNQRLSYVILFPQLVLKAYSFERFMKSEMKKQLRFSSFHAVLQYPAIFQSLSLRISLHLSRFRSLSLVLGWEILKHDLKIPALQLKGWRQTALKVTSMWNNSATSTVYIRPRQAPRERVWHYISVCAALYGFFIPFSILCFISPPFYLSCPQSQNLSPSPRHLVEQ